MNKDLLYALAAIVGLLIAFGIEVNKAGGFSELNWKNIATRYGLCGLASAALVYWIGEPAVITILIVLAVCGLALVARNNLSFKKKDE